MNSLLDSRRSFLLAFVALFSIAYFVGGGKLGAANERLQVPQASIAEAKALIDAGALVLDVRGPEQYRQRHLPNAIFLPLDALAAGIPQWLEASRDKPVVVYCNDGLGRGPAVTAKLQGAGFTQAVNLSSGVEGWTAAKLPIVKG